MNVTYFIVIKTILCKDEKTNIPDCPKISVVRFKCLLPLNEVANNASFAKRTFISEQKSMMKGQQRLRWNIVLTILSYLFGFMPLWLDFTKIAIANYVIPTIQFLFTFMWLCIIIYACKTMATLSK